MYNSSDFFKQELEELSPLKISQCLSNPNFIDSKKTPSFIKYIDDSNFKSTRLHHVDLKRVPLTYQEEILLMMSKHYIIYSRNIKTLLFIFLTPLFFFYLLYAMKCINDILQARNTTIDHPKIEIGKATLNCFLALHWENCISLAIAVTGNPTVEESNDVKYIMQSISNQTELVLDKDIIKLNQTFNDYNDIYDDILDKKTAKHDINSKTNNNVLYQFILAFCYGDYEVVKGVKVPCKPDFNHNQSFYLYTIIYNISNTPNVLVGGLSAPIPIDPQLTHLKLIVDNAYLSLFSYKYPKQNMMTTPKIANLTYQSYPSTYNRLYKRINVSSLFGSFYFYFPSMIVFSIILLDIVKENESNLKQFTILNGMSLISYWISWFIVAIIFSFCLSIEITILGSYIFSFEIFTNVNLIITFSLYFFFTLSIQCMAMTISNYVSSIRQATTVSYSIIIFGIVFQTVLSNYTIFYFLYATNVEIIWLRILLKLIMLVIHLYPPFVFTKCFNDISTISAGHFDYEKMEWIMGQPYTFKNIFLQDSGEMIIGIKYAIESMFETFIWFFICIIIYTCVVILKEIKHSYKEMKTLQSDNNNQWLIIKILKLFCPNRNPIVYLKHFYDTNFNCIERNKKRNLIENSINKYYERLLKENNNNDSSIRNIKSPTVLFFAENDISVMKERIKIAEEHSKNSQTSGLRLHSLSKSFISNSNEKINAVVDINLDISKGISFGLLGPNGSGKTTLINLLTNQLRSDNGYAKVGPFIIHSEMFIDSINIKRLIGVCLQFDHYWVEMTVIDIITFFAKMKGIKSHLIIKEKIAMIGLKGKENEFISSLSGGMKRRVSILITILGDPSLLYLDEPTTGLDPVNRRKIWKLISEIKKNRVVLLSTQNIEEADYLCDKIGIMCNGRLMFIGTSTDIIRMNPSSFILEITVDTKKINMTQWNIVDNNLKYVFIRSKVKSCNSGVITISIDYDNKIEIRKAMEMMNRRPSAIKLKEILPYLKDIFVSQNNLEKSFIELCNKYN